MELEHIRKQLDKLDQSLKYIILLRTSLAVSVGKVKAEKDLPVYQADREQAIYGALKDFCEQTGVNIKLLTGIYKDLIAESIRIEENLEQYLHTTCCDHLEVIAPPLDRSMQSLNEFVTHMDSVTDCLNARCVDGNSFFKLISETCASLLETTGTTSERKKNDREQTTCKDGRLTV